ncbi:BnaC06g05760D [Brassica napus]|uniref:ATP-dependent DNA helicase n=1 Tax=Brassica napus TaxID=3708 RepID=A0A078GN70_BRANA|nr:BnaC06g05760D [Brassica napus]
MPKIKHVLLRELGNRGTGKTFLYQTIISRIRSRKQIVLPVVSSGIAALLLPNGRTTHSCFNIPLKLSEDKLCNIKPGTMLVELIEKTDLIIWDEAPMTHKHAFEALNKTQILPVIPQGNRADTVLASISHSYLWGSCHTHLESGYECDNYHEQMIVVDKSLIRTSYTDKAILTPRNETVDEINTYTISQTDGVSRVYFSSNSFEISDTRSKHNETLYSIEYLNSLEFSGLPSHKLTLKVGAPAEIVTGSHIGKEVLIPRIVLLHEETKLPFTLRRRQFPIRLCYAMTINKSQAKSLKQVILYLPKPVFARGQLYVAISRVTSKAGLTIIKYEDSHQLRIYSPQHISQTMVQSNEEELTRSLYPAMPCYFFLMGPHIISCYPNDLNFFLYCF